MIGGGQHEHVRAACLVMLGLTNEYVDDFIAACTSGAEFPLPAEGQVFFHLLTTRGPYRAACLEADLVAQQDPFAALFHNCQTVLTELRLVDEAREA